MWDFKNDEGKDKKAAACTRFRQWHEGVGQNNYFTIENKTHLLTIYMMFTTMLICSSHVSLMDYNYFIHDHACSFIKL